MLDASVDAPIVIHHVSSRVSVRFSQLEERGGDVCVILLALLSSVLVGRTPLSYTHTLEISRVLSVALLLCRCKWETPAFPFTQPSSAPRRARPLLDVRDVRLQVTKLCLCALSCRTRRPHAS